MILIYLFKCSSAVNSVTFPFIAAVGNNIFKSDYHLNTNSLITIAGILSNLLHLNISVASPANINTFSTSYRSIDNVNDKPIIFD